MRPQYWAPLYQEKVATIIAHNFHTLRLVELPFMRFDRIVNEQPTYMSLTFSVVRYINLEKIDLFNLAAALQKHMERYNPTIEEIRHYMVYGVESACYFTTTPEGVHNITITDPKRFLNHISSGNIYAQPYNPDDIIDFLESEVI